MQISQISPSFRHGARLRYPLRDSRGVLLLAQGAEITERLYDLLHLRGISLEVQASFTVTGGETSGQEIPISHAQMTIGRSPECEIRIVNPVVSNYHCRLYKFPLDILLEDLDSRNGTYRNDQRIMGRTALNDQDRIRVGGSVLTLNLFAAVSANSNEGDRALQSWILGDAGSRQKELPAYGATEPDFCLDDELPS